MAEIARNVAVALTVAGALIGGPRQSAAADGEAVTNTTHTSTTGAVRETQAATDAGATVIVAGRANAQTPVLLGFMESDIRVAVRRAVEGAAGRLARPAARTFSPTLPMKAANASRPRLQRPGTVQPRP